jgi:hypothetical protein
MSHALDFLIAIVMVFLAFSVMVSGATEMWNWRNGKRGEFLWKGIGRMVGATDEATQILQKLRGHPAIRALAQDDTPRRSASYIPGTVFAAALTDVVLERSVGVRMEKYGLPEAIALLPPNLPLKRVLQMVWAQARGDDAHFELELARYFDTCMDRVSGWYKRDAQVRSLWLGLLLATILNVDAVHIAIALWQDPQLTRSVADQAPAMAAQYQAANPLVKPQPDTPAGAPAPVPAATKTTGTDAGSATIALPQELPVGWPPRWYSELPEDATRLQLAWHIAATILGLLLMAGSCLVGAPMWYQILASLLPLRASGKVPPRTPRGTTPPPPSERSAPASSGPPGTAPASPSPEGASGTGQVWANELEHMIVEQGAVHEVQKALNVPETGLLDDQTRTAIRAYQDNAGYGPTGQLTQLLLRDLGLGGRF